MQKDRKIRNLDTSVTLLKNFLLFVNNKAIKGLRVSNEDIKKEIESVKEKYNKELEENKAKLIEQIEKCAKTLPSDALQNKLKQTEEEFEKYKQEQKGKSLKLSKQYL